jgi:cyclic-di-AMP phosphodiesterase PgpH
LLNYFTTFVISNISDMTKVIEWFQRNQSMLYKAILFLLAIVIIVQLFPRMPRFGYEYQVARPWTYDDLIAPFNFAILKTQEELEDEKRMVRNNFRPFFYMDKNIVLDQSEAYKTAFFKLADSIFPGNSLPPQLENTLLTGQQLIDSVFTRGIIFLNENFIHKPSDFEVILTLDRLATVKQLKEFFTISQAFKFVHEQLNTFNTDEATFLKHVFEKILVHNVFYDNELSDRALEAELEEIPLSRGMVQEGEKIISKGELISPEKFQIIESYKAEYLKIIGRTANRYTLYIGQFLLVAISMIVLVLFLYVLKRDIFLDNRRILLILLTLLIMVSVTSQVIKYNSGFLYLLPVCIVPLVIRAFFDNRLALYVHINTIILIGFLIPRSFEFVFIQFIAGIIAILSMVSLRRRSQLFFTVFLIFITYSAVYLGLTLAHGGTLSDLKLLDYLYMSGSALLTLFAYPLIFLFERIFGLPTDFSLLELADTNNKLLRELGMNAAGTFQHSLQVANLAEEAIFALGGNTLLTRTGALYHDIGKIDNPHYFTENQTSGVNPHDDLNFKESAAIIIDHVIKGIELARKNNLPEYIIDFIRTHHGTTTARYFFTMHVKENPKVKASRSDFTYPGPKPFSKETAVVMMADSVEAASRSLIQPDEHQISRLVDQIIDTQIEEQQFIHAPITFKDIDIIKRLFKKRLLNMFHVRIAYPSMS